LNIIVPQVFVLLGHNGSGKTTTINMLTGKLSPSSGDAYVMGNSVRDNVHNIQRLVGSVPQHDLLWGSLSAAEHIRMFAQIKGIPRARLSDEVVSVLQQVHLLESGEQPAGEYSGGMKRRLSIALAGIGGPRVIMLDEPTTGTCFTDMSYGMFSELSYLSDCRRHRSIESSQNLEAGERIKARSYRNTDHALDAGSRLVRVRKTLWYVLTAG
jgi:ABC-type Na+ transport system ATPase subunit NatA